MHHAYLFVGSRGTGQDVDGEDPGGFAELPPNGGPDGSRRAASASPAARSPTATSLDVVEMDAASNNSVDDIRDLRERVAYAPVGGGYKVYILDEAHMLTPAGVERVPQDARGAAAAHDLRAGHDRGQQGPADGRGPLPPLRLRPPVACPRSRSVLRRVADAESIEIPDEAVALVARSATGLVPRRARDAGAAARVLRARRSRSTTCSPCSAPPTPTCCSAPSTRSPAGDARAALLAAARLAESGRDLGRFFGDLEAHARALMVVQVLGDVPPELRVTPEQDERLAEQAARVGRAEVVRLLELIAAALRAMKDGADARTQLELALVKAATPDLEPSVKALQARIARLESRPAGARRGEDARARGDRRRPRRVARPTPLRRPRGRRQSPARCAPRRRPRRPPRRSGRARRRSGRPERRRSAGRRAASGRAAARRRPSRPDASRFAGAATPARAAARTSPSPRRSTGSRRSRSPRRCPAPATSTAQRGAAGRRRRRRRGRAASSRPRPTRRRPSPRSRRSTRTRRRPRRAWSSRSTRSATSGPRSSTRCARARRCSPRARRRRARRARRRRADARVAGVVGVPQAQGRGPREPRR